MFGIFAKSQRAGWLLLLEIGGAVALGLGGAPEHLVFAVVWFANLVVAWNLALAAKALGKSSLGYGLFSALAPPAAIYCFFSLHGQDAAARFDQRPSGHEV